MAQRLEFIVSVVALCALVGCPAGCSRDRARTTQPLTDYAAALSAREHLPVHLRLSGLVFASKDPILVGWASGLLSEGKYAIVINPSNAQWWRADRYDELEVHMDEVGTLTATLEGRTITGQFNEHTGSLWWDDREYECTNLPPPYPAAPPDWQWDIKLARAANHARAVAEVDGGLRIDLGSPIRDYMRQGFGLGSIGVRTLGHDGRYCVFDYVYEVEGGYSVRRQRLPIFMRHATLGVAEGSLRFETSFDTADSREVYAGSVFFRRAPAGTFPWVQRNLTDDSPFCAWTQDLLPGEGRPIKSAREIEICCWFYADDNYVARKTDSRQGENLQFVVGDSAALDAAIIDMRIGGWRRAQLREEVAQRVVGIAGKLKREEIICMEFQLLRAD